jgi:hypothetical protein
MPLPRKRSPSARPCGSIASRAYGQLVPILWASLFVGVLACASQQEVKPGTPMKTSCPSAIGLPTVEECTEEAMKITDELLRMCMLRQCNNIDITCSEWSRLECKEQGLTGSTLLAFTVMTYHGTLHSFIPVKETHWCENPASHECIVKAVVHEVAHSCGWDHREGRNVPGNDPEHEAIPECQCVGANGERKACR